MITDNTTIAFDTDADWSAGWARTGNFGPETWGDWCDPSDGSWLRLYRGKRNVCRFYNRQGEQVGPEQSNVAPAYAAARAFGYLPLP